MDRWRVYQDPSLAASPFMETPHCEPFEGTPPAGVIFSQPGVLLLARPVISAGRRPALPGAYPRRAWA